MSDLQFNMAAAANVVGAPTAEQTGGHACSRPAVPAQGGGTGRVEGGRGRTGEREDAQARSEEEDNFISFWGGELHQERFGKEGTQAVWFCQR